MLLNQTAQNLRNQSLVEERVRASVLMYFIFILSAVIFGAPVLFALSSYLAEVMINQLSALSIPQGIPSPITISAITISMNFILGFIVLTIVTLCIFGSIALGMIRKGSGKEGVRYILPLIVLSLGLFFLVRGAIGSLFSGII